MKPVTVDRQIDIEFRVKYQYIQSQQPKKRLDDLIRFLLEQQWTKPKEDNDRSTLLPS